MALEYTKHDWVVEIQTPVQEITEEEKSTVLDLILDNTFVRWKKQKLTPQEQLDFISGFGAVDRYWKNWEHVNNKHLFFEGYPGIIRVSGKLKDGKIGQFGHKEVLKWHCNRPQDPNRKPFVWLYAVGGSEGSVTHWTNNFLAYNDLTAEEKAFYETIKIQYIGHRFEKEMKYTNNKLRYERVDNQLAQMDLWHKMILTNPNGKKGIWISPLEVGSIDGMSEKEMLEFTQEMLEKLTRPKYVYSHKWEDGDLTISEQFFGLHQRDHFENMHLRELHRIGFNANKLIPDMRYEGYNGYLEGHTGFLDYFPAEHKD
jgi:taurine dioxygenase